MNSVDVYDSYIDKQKMHFKFILYIYLLQMYHTI